MKIPSNLIATLRQRDVDNVAKTLAAETGLVRRPLVDGERTAGAYRRMVVTASGRFAMLDDGPGFSLVLWRPILEQRMGQQLSATLRAITLPGTLAGDETFQDSPSQQFASV